MNSSFHHTALVTTYVKNITSYCVISSLLGTQITCFPPTNFTLRQAAYVDSFCWAAVEHHPTENGADSAPLHLHKVMMNNNDISKEVLRCFVFVLLYVSLPAVLSLYPSAGCHPHVYSCSLLALHGCPFPILWPQFYHGGTWPLLQPCHPPCQEPHNQTRQRHCRRPTQV